MKKFALVYESKVVAVLLPDSSPGGQALEAALQSNPSFVQVDLENPADVGWVYTGTEYVRGDA